MADMYGSSNAYSPTPSSSSASLPLESEDLSTFLQQFLHPSSASSTCMPFRAHQLYGNSSSSSSVPLGLGLENSNGVTVASRIGIGPSKLVTPSSSEINFAELGGYFGPSGLNEDVSRKGFSFVDGLGIGNHVDSEFRHENDEIEFRFDSENGGGSGSCANPVKSRSSSKRGRAAEVHNLSEKRRRSRINEKLKALQKLVPNSNKSDKASMLDEAIEYLKQLQLQVQMLSIRNGVSLHSMCMPGVAQPLHLSNEGTSYGGGNDMLLSMGKDKLTTTSPMTTFTSNQEPAVQPCIEISNHGNSSGQPVQPSLNNISNSEIPTFCFDRTIEAHYKNFDFSSSSHSKDMRSEGTRLLDGKKS